MFSVEEIRENYKKLEDYQIEKLAANESKTLRREVLVVLKDEIEKRNLNPTLITWIDAETNPLSEAEKKELTKKMKNLTCPNCKRTKTVLSGHEFTTIISMLIICKQKTQKKILCDSCASSEKMSAFFQTFLFGWWSRSGILLTPYTLIKQPINFFFKKKINTRVMNDFFTVTNGLIRIQGSEDKALEEIIKKYNTIDA